MRASHSTPMAGLLADVCLVVVELNNGIARAIAATSVKSRAVQESSSDVKKGKPASQFT